jgi:hypothetical protein
LNPFVLARLELVSPRPVEEALGALDQLVAEGFDADGRTYRLFGFRRGRYFTMSLGMPILGGGAPVLRAWLPEDAIAARFDVTVGARLELVVAATLWAALIAIGGGTQLYLQLAAVTAGRAGAGAVLEVLPGIGIMVALLLLGFWFFRRRAATDTRLLLASFRHALGVQAPDAPAAAPLH